ncbi:MAG: heat-shock protein Hsp70 [Bacteroidetes bacterium]|nr:heat-shock protein Hsp70 [Bacteroidota bacterium]
MIYFCGLAKINIDIKSGSLFQAGLAVGIDLGTTNSLIAWVDPQTHSAEVIPIAEGANLFPSLVYLSKSGEILTGPAAQTALSTEGDRVIYSVKRLIGISATDYETIRARYSYLQRAAYTQEGVMIQGAEDRWYSAVDLSSFILSDLKKIGAAKKQAAITKAVITVPAYFDESQRAATKQAGERAGLEVLRIINEPTAACLAYGYGDPATSPRHIVVFDLGGGTFDVSVVRVESGVFEVLSTHGDTQLGGDDIDRSVMQHWSGQHPNATTNQAAALRLLSKEAKEVLSAADAFSKEWMGVDYRLTKKELEQLSAPWVDRTIDSCTQALADAGLQRKDIQDVILVGGSTRMPYVKKRVSDFFGLAVNDRINPDEVVAIGAALQAAQLNGTELGHLLLDVTPLSLGIETAGGLMDVLLPRNSKIPLSISRQYTTQRDGQTSIQISVYQGERDLIEFNRKLASFQVSGIPAMPAGLPKLTIRFQIDANGLLKVEAHESRSGVRQEVVVNPAEALTKDQIDQQLQEAFTHAEADKEARTRISLMEEAQTMVLNLHKLLRTNQAWITPQDKEALTAHCQAMEIAIKQGNSDQLSALMKEAEEKARPITEEVMNRAVGDRLRDTSI